MKVLMIVQNAPLPPPMGMSSAKRNFPFFEGAANRHDVSVLSYGTPEEEAIFRKHFGNACEHIRFVDNRRPRLENLWRRVWYFISGKSLFYLSYNESMQNAIDEAASKIRFDLIHCCMPLFGYHRFPPNVPLLTDTHNVEYDLVLRHAKTTRNILLKLYFMLSYKTAKADELKNLRRFDLVVAPTEPDRNLMAPEIPEKTIRVISNGVDEIFFEDLKMAREPKTMIFMGSMSYYPNHHAVIHFLDEIFPLICAKAPGSRVVIVGPNPSPIVKRRAAENIIVTGFVDDVRPYVAKSEVFIIPIRIGGGIRGKALEAMAMNIPIVTTTIGCEGINLKDRTSALFADAPEKFADCVVELFNTPELRSRIAAAARATVRREYDWKEKQRNLEECYQSLMTRSARHQGAAERVA